MGDWFCLTGCLTSLAADWCWNAGSRRPSLASVHSSASSTKSMSFGMRRFEREREQRLRRQQLQLQQVEQPTPGSACTPSSASGDLGAGLPIPTPVDRCGSLSRSRGASPSTSPNPLSPMSTDKLLPALDELVEVGILRTCADSRTAAWSIAAHGGLPCPVPTS